MVYIERTPRESRFVERKGLRRICEENISRWDGPTPRVEVDIRDDRIVVGNIDLLYYQPPEPRIFLRDVIVTSGKRVERIMERNQPLRGTNRRKEYDQR